MDSMPGENVGSLLSAMAVGDWGRVSSRQLHTGDHRRILPAAAKRLEEANLRLRSIALGLGQLTASVCAVALRLEQLQEVVGSGAEPGF
jgi:hypothetical protein